MEHSQRDSLRKALAPHSTCLISDVLLKAKIPYGGFLPGLEMWSPERQAGTTKLIGPAYTVRFALVHEPNAPTPEKHYIDTIPEGAVVFVSSPKGIPNATYGGLMTHRAKASNAAGTIIDGRFRDLDEQRKLNWPVFAREVGTPAYHGTARPSEVNVPVRFQDGLVDTVITPGDWLVADINGVVSIPAALVSEVAEKLDSLAAAEERIEQDIANGGEFAASSKRHRS